MRRILPIIIIYLFYFADGYATIHYVQHGQGNVPPYLTWGNAADSIQSAINVCSPSDTVLVANGVYPENLVINGIPIYLLGSSMDSTIIDGTGLSDSTIFFNNSNSTIKNFNIKGAGLGIPSRAITLQDYSITTRNCRISQVSVGIGTIGSNAGILAYNVMMSDIYHGFSLYNNTNNIVSDCLLILNQENSIGILIGGPNPNSIYTITNNIILFTNYPRFANAGILIGAPKKVYIYNNLISFYPYCIYINDISDTVFIKNNTLPNDDPRGNLGISSGGFPTVVINNIFSRNGMGIDGSNHTKSNYNIFWRNGQNYHYVVPGDSDMIRDPMFVKDTIPAQDGNYDFHLQAFSPGIDKGDPSIKDVDGTRSDIGMFGGPYGQSYTYQDLAPRPPVNLSAVVDTNGVHLKWNKNTEADTAYYRVYKDTVPNFIIDSTKIIGTPADTFFTDIISKGSIHLYYKITAVDKQGNQSGPSDEVGVTITGIKEYPFVINDYKLYQNYPNPFNPTTKIGYRLKESGYVKLMVFDVLGKLVKVLVNKYQSAGYYEVEFGSQKSEVKDQLASGIYIYRIEVIGKGNIPVFTDMKKMVLLK